VRAPGIQDRPKRPRAPISGHVTLLAAVIYAIFSNPANVRFASFAARIPSFVFVEPG